ncbi:hypothetical protein FDP41_000247 [Naegleria fowleri]|uniref:F-box domain-containing protein n=1 Tax=Naegleria fowleri TaxID=5763 RepID=A0A6A5CJ16_NAEFO|nr:uncharacterized protein FDP41_000247 [Naegleria fowleri]KAF0985208.1 hypothetical protein FDP41_000247 [Naegleria fowleri]
MNESGEERDQESDLCVVEWLSERDLNNSKSDWDLIALNASSLIAWIQRIEKSIHKITLNYFTKYCDVKKSIKDEIALERAQFISDQDWQELSFKLEMKDGSIIEIELSSDMDYLKEFLQLQQQTLSNDITPTPPQYFEKDELVLAPLILLQTIKESHIIFPVGDVQKHLKDLQILKYLARSYNLSTFERGDFFEHLDTDDPLMKFFYNRFVKTLWASLIPEKIRACTNMDLLQQDKPLDESDFENAILDIDEMVKFKDDHLITLKGDVADIYEMQETTNFEGYYSTNAISYGDSSVADWLSEEVMLVALAEFIVPKVMGFDMISEIVLKSIQFLWNKYSRTNVAWSIADHMAFVYSESLSKLKASEEMVMEKFDENKNSTDMYLTKSDYCGIHELIPSTSEYHNEGLSLFSSRFFLNSDVLFHIFEYIPQFETLKNLQLLNKECYQFMNGSIFWKKIFFHHWPVASHYVSSISEQMTDDDDTSITFMPFAAPFETNLHSCRDYGGYRPGDSKCWGYQSVLDFSIHIDSIQLISTSEKSKLWNASVTECSFGGIGDRQSLNDEKYKAIVGPFYASKIDQRDALSVLSLLLSFMGTAGSGSILIDMVSLMNNYADERSYWN